MENLHSNLVNDTYIYMCICVYHWRSDKLGLQLAQHNFPPRTIADGINFVWVHHRGRARISLRTFGTYVRRAWAILCFHAGEHIGLACVRYMYRLNCVCVNTSVIQIIMNYFFSILRWHRRKNRFGFRGEFGLLLHCKLQRMNYRNFIQVKCVLTHAAPARFPFVCATRLVRAMQCSSHAESISAGATMRRHI